MFEALLAQLVSRSATLHQRPQGVAFLRLAKDLYKLSSVAYLGVNIAIARQKSVYVHCTYSDTSVKHCIGNSQILLHRMAKGDRCNSSRPMSTTTRS